jgi:hypothetical protein
MREANKERYDLVNRVRDGRVEIGTLVLLHRHDADVDMSRSKKLAFRWAGPYRVKDCIEDRGTYLLEELDGTQLKGTFAGNRIRPFHIRQREQVVADETDTENETPAQDINDDQIDGDADFEQGSLDEGSGEGRSEDPESSRFRRLPRDFIINVPSRESIMNQNRPRYRLRRQGKRRLNVIDGSEDE